ncbi:MAG TPA: RodZ domain-containing protein [Casimicrobiaceae bacterium]|nr:RodZ domain-containing protein [Casimicrobiaceae bacterium]
MSHEQSLSGAHESHDPALSAIEAGAMLRDAREAAGLSLDTVSAQLKLAPRQVKALEDGEFNLLPGRTFVRGFARNYARLVHLDPDTVLQALGAPTIGGLEAPPLHPTTGTMGELPSTGRVRPAWVRWLAPALIVLVLIAAGGYEYLRAPRKAPAAGQAAKAEAPSTAPSAVASAPAPAGSTSARAPAAAALPNPVLATPLDSGPGAADASSAGQTAGAGDAASIAPLNVSLRGASWVEVRDGTGRIILSQTLNAGQSQAIVGTPPFDITIGNAPEVTLTFRGRAVDLAPYTRQNVARLTLQ